MSATALSINSEFRGCRSHANGDKVIAVEFSKAMSLSIYFSSKHLMELQEIIKAEKLRTVG